MAKQTNRASSQDSNPSSDSVVNILSVPCTSKDVILCALPRVARQVEVNQAQCLKHSEC